MPDFVHRRLRAPAADGHAFIDPPLAQAAALIERNRAIGAEFDRVAGLPADLRIAARILLISTAAAREGVEADGRELRGPLILSGHQPELFHPGVWLKNFVLSALAKSVRGTGINLVIDNDTIRTAGIRVPTLAGGQPQIIEVPFDAAGPAIPWENRPLLDEDRFEGFSRAVREAFAPFLASPAYRRGILVDRVWRHAVEAADEQREQIRNSLQRLRRGDPSPELISEMSNLGACLAMARHRVEREIGLATRETDLAQLASDAPFLEFAECLIARHREFHALHNAALAEYRTVNHVRSHSHPVPDLAREGDWHELPFWIWDFNQPARRRAFVRQAGASWELADRERRVVVHGSECRDRDGLWQRLLDIGCYLRPRALITTMYARLVLSDLFVHGIGGAKYDEVTDLIIRRFFQIEPPAYITATATFRLPIDRPQVTPDEVRRLALRIREARFRPEAFVRDELVTREPAIAEPLAALAAEKREYLARHDLRRCAQEVFARLDSLNRAMHDVLAPVERELRAGHAELVAQLKASQLLGSREFSFVLFPSEILPARLLDLCKVSS